MRNTTRASLSALLIVPAILAFRSTNTPMQVDASSRLWVKGSSTVRGFECQAARFDAKVVAAVPDAAAAVLEGEKGVASVALSVETQKLDCRNGTMNGHMLKALKATEHPIITWTLAGYEVRKGAEGVDLTLTGTLSLGGVTKELTIAATGKAGPEGTLQVTGTHELNMRDYGLKPPTLMLGTMKVHEKVVVNFDFLLKN